MPKKSLAPILTLGFFAALLIAAMSFGYVKYIRPKNENNNTNTVTNSKGNLQTYTNNVWGFSFKYPEDWSLKEDNLPNSIRESKPEEYLKLQGWKSDGGDQVYAMDFKLYVNQGEFIADKCGSTYTIARENHKFKILKKETKSILDYTKWSCIISITEQEFSQNNLYMTIEAYSEEWLVKYIDELTRSLISTFQFTD